jgi:hypothetical protein
LKKVITGNSQSLIDDYLDRLRIVFEKGESLVNENENLKE